MKIEKVGIAGAGLMGASMSQIFAKFGYSVIVYDAFDSALEKGRHLIEVNQEAQVNNNEATKEDAEKRISSQKPWSVYEAASNVVIDNSAGNDDVKKELDKLISRI